MRSRLEKVGNRFRSTFQFLDGGKFYGQLLELPDTSRVSNFLSARRYLRTGPLTPVRAGHIVIANSIKYIVAEHGEGYFVDNIYKHFKLFEVDEIAEWYPVKTITDPVTGIEELTRDEYEEDVYLSTQPVAPSTDTLHIPNPNKVAVCNTQVSVDDKIGDRIVTRVDRVLGVYLITMKDI